jgi:hypothetical protein
MQTPPKDIIDALDRMHLLTGGAPKGEPLGGGTSSDIWRIDLPDRPICIKRALAKLRVSVDCRAPVQRNFYEARWMKVASRVAPNGVPEMLGQDEVTGTLAMTYLPTERYALWKALLRDEVFDLAFAASVADALVQIHAATAADPSIGLDFPTDTIFRDIRLEPDLTHTGRVHRNLAHRSRWQIACGVHHSRSSSRQSAAGGSSPACRPPPDRLADKVRRVARRLLAAPPDRLADVAQAWKEELTA